MGHNYQVILISMTCFVHNRKQNEEQIHMYKLIRTLISKTEDDKLHLSTTDACTCTMHTRFPINRK